MRIPNEYIELALIIGMAILTVTMGITCEVLIAKLKDAKLELAKSRQEIHLWEEKTRARKLKDNALDAYTEYWLTHDFPPAKPRYTISYSQREGRNARRAQR